MFYICTIVKFFYTIGMMEWTTNKNLRQKIMIV
jgi:hypothetical protein